MTPLKNDLIKEIIESSSEKVFQDLVCKLYQDSAVEELMMLGVTSIIEATNRTFDLMKNRKDNSRKIEVSNLESNKEWYVLQVVGQEIPFLLESISNEIKLQEIEIKAILHAVVGVKRDESGNIIEITDENAHKESVVQVYIPSWFGYEYYSNLVARLYTIAKCVELAVTDWEEMKRQVKSCRDYITLYQAHHEEERGEYEAFLDWIIDKNFILLGSFVLKQENGILNVLKGSELGICKDSFYKSMPITFDDCEDAVVVVAKSESRSLVHRTDYMNCICVKKYDANTKKWVEKQVFLGFFTSATYYQSARNIPFIRMKVNHVLTKYGHDESSFNAKELITALEAFPRSDLFQMSEDTLYEMATGIVSLSLSPKVKAFARPDRAKKFVSFILFIPKKSSSTQSIKIVERIIEQQLHGNIVKRYVQINDGQLTRLQFVIKLHSEGHLIYNIQKIEELIMGAISIWQDELFKSLCVKHSRNEATLQYQKYKDAFDIRYTLNFVAQQAVHDIYMIEQTLLDQDIKFSFYISAKSGRELAQLKIFSPSELLSLSSTLPIIENMGFLVFDMQTFKTQVKVLGEEKEINIDYFRLEPKNKNFKTTYDDIKQEIENAFSKIWHGALENDEFNALIFYTKITWREVAMLRAYAKYLKQIRFIYSPGVISSALANNAGITSKLVELFHCKFNPMNEKSAQKQINVIKSTINDMLLSVQDITEDRILRMYFTLIVATKRTNYFQKNDDLEYNEYISFKIASEEINDMPLPKPFREIWVYSPKFEAIHLRGGKVARGGIRWSDRHEDFRTEILGLMKAQMTKNSVIVPVGSKGGFVVKSVTPASGRDVFLEEGVKCYRQFLSGVLDLTDNILNDSIVTPAGILRHDEDDPYLVVAADKGTATFSDYANAISKKYNFWLDDAFASGGSAGYDHKKISITARGAWISVERHFMELGINIKEQEFTVVGIGDMSGDVFGNGMLLSNKIKLVCAFNHNHIFLDPNPDPVMSFNERMRLFKLPGSQWSDYNVDIISEGGGIFERSTKSIPLSQEVQKMLDVKDDAMSPDELINAALKAPVDLIWNGGIGTYVKAASETNDMIGDKSNDALRVNANELRCKAFAEGGNLGCTQLGRIEYSRNGGKINADFIDNSGGVDCSDHEVNIKIGFSEMLRNNQISLEERNQLLIEMTDDVVALVLRDNYKQTQLISLEEVSGRRRLDEHFWLMQYLESNKELNRGVEKLPKNDELSSILAKYGKLSRPEIAVLIAYAKTSAIKHLHDYKLSSDPYILKGLINYFPKMIQERYSDVFVHHKLKDEIINTTLINDFVNMLGACFFHQLLNDGLYSAENIIKAFVIARDSLGINDIWHAVEKLGNIISFAAQSRLFITLQKIVSSNILVILNHKKTVEDVGALISSYQHYIAELKELFDDNALTRGVTNCLSTSLEQNLKAESIPQDIITKIIELNILSSIFDIAHISECTKFSIKESAAVYFELSEKLKIFVILERVQHAILKDYIDIMALRNLSSDILYSRLALSIRHLTHTKKSKKNINESNILGDCSYNENNLKRYNEILEKIYQAPDESLIAILVIIRQQLASLFDSLG